MKFAAQAFLSCTGCPEVLIQLLAARGFQVYAVVRKHSGEEWIKQKLQGLGASQVFLAQADIRARLEEMDQPLPQLALDGVGGAATNQLVSALAKTADLVCFGVAGGSNQQAVTLATGKKWKGSLLQFSFDEWLNRDVAANSKILNEMLLDVTQLVKQKKMQFVIKEYTTERFNMAVLNAKQIGRTHAVVLHMPRLEQNPVRYTQAEALVVPETSLDKDNLARHNRSWDLDFLQWEDNNTDEEIDWRIQKEENLFQKVSHPAAGAIQRFSEATPTAIAQELGCSADKAEAVMFWLPGRGEIPQEHAHWLERICSLNRELRILILEPHQLEQDLKWQLACGLNVDIVTKCFDSDSLNSCCSGSGMTCYLDATCDSTVSATCDCKIRLWSFQVRQRCSVALTHVLVILFIRICCFRMMNVQYIVNTHDEPSSCL